MQKGRQTHSSKLHTIVTLKLLEQRHTLTNLEKQYEHHSTTDLDLAGSTSAKHGLHEFMNAYDIRLQTDISLTLSHTLLSKMAKFG